MDAYLSKLQARSAQQRNAKQSQKHTQEDMDSTMMQSGDSNKGDSNERIKNDKSNKRNATDLSEQFFGRFRHCECLTIRVNEDIHIHDWWLQAVQHIGKHYSVTSTIKSMTIDDLTMNEHYAAVIASQRASLQCLTMYCNWLHKTKYEGKVLDMIFDSCVHLQYLYLPNVRLSAWDRIIKLVTQQRKLTDDNGGGGGGGDDNDNDNDVMLKELVVYAITNTNNESEHESKLKQLEFVSKHRWRVTKNVYSPQCRFPLRFSVFDFDRTVWFIERIDPLRSRIYVDSPRKQ